MPVVARRTVIAVIGKSAKDPSDPVPPAALEMAEVVGREIAKRGGIVSSGGLSGVMEAVSKGAKEAGGLTLGILPGDDADDANRYVDIPIATGMGAMRDVLNVRVGDAVIAISGGVGTLRELTEAYETRPVVVLRGTGGWADKLPDLAYEGHYLEGGKVGYLHFASTPEEAVELAFRLVAERSRPRPRVIR